MLCLPGLSTSIILLIIYLKSTSNWAFQSKEGTSLEIKLGHMLS